MPSPLKLSKPDARRAMARYQFTPSSTQMEAFHRLRSVQFDPIAPVGCNHDLVLQARVPGYKVGDWQKVTYEDRLVYDGWDKQASLVPFSGWPLRRIFHRWYQPRLDRITKEHPHAVEAILNELKERGPLMPKECEFQERRTELQHTWFGPNLSKQVLRALWHAGVVMTAGRRNGHHVYDLTERVVPPEYYNQPVLSEKEALRELILDRHKAVGLIRPSAPPEMWSYVIKSPERAEAINELIDKGDLVPVDVEGVKAHTTPEFLSQLDLPALDSRVAFVAPLDQLMWDRKMVAHLFDFDYVWEIYMPEHKRRWGYYVLPVLYGDELVARVEFHSRKGVLEVRRWLSEPNKIGPAFLDELDRTFKAFKEYCGAKTVHADAGVDATIRKVLR